VLKQMKAGDLVSVYAENDQIWYAEVVATEESTIDVYYIQRGDNNVWSYSDDVFEISMCCVENHIVTSSHANIVSAYRSLGFRPLTDSTFVRLDETGVTPVGDAAFDDIEEDDCVGIHPEMRDFIVPDEEGEAFTLAAATNDFVRDTHKAVRDFNNWHPDGEATRVKDFIETMDTRACHQENARTRLGEGISYNNPPLE
jgi:hypothetical protein